MGTFSWPVTVASLDGAMRRQVDATVDTGATYTAMPAGMLREMGITPLRQATLETADGRILEMDIGEARVTIDGLSGVTPVLFAGEDVPPILGAVTMEELSLAVDPVGRRLVPTRAIWY